MMSEPFHARDGSSAMRHVVTPETTPAEWRARCHGARGDVRALRIGSGSRAVGHVATPEPSPGGWHARCHEA
jgi:hypothetical protein